ncbi:hypothetical protein H9Q74_004392 [Fusarium xylarioides]|nr:hypothetical protein H9Q71_004511 [Fusarium xylarioides]KAG5825517.1 hypothetical protein H9Q74_004392 [Fusarium xylarioides]
MSTTQFAKDQPEGFSNRIGRVAIVGVCFIYHLLAFFSDIAWAGGRQGAQITEQLLKTGKHAITALTRIGSTSKLPDNVKAIPVDYEDDKSPTIAQFYNKPVYLSSFYEIKYESSADRIENGKAMGRSGNIMGLVQAYYSFIFSPDGQKLKTQDKLHNELLGLPEQDLDEVVKDCVERAENKFRPL